MLLPDVPFTQIVGMRHRLVHVYWSVDLDLLWEVTQKDLEPLIEALHAALDEWPLPGGESDPPSD